MDKESQPPLPEMEVLPPLPPEDEAPPLPPEDPPAPPPPSMQTSNSSCDWLDFDSGDGGKLSSELSEPPPAKRRRSDAEDGEISCDDSDTDNQLKRKCVTKICTTQSLDSIKEKEGKLTSLEEGEISDSYDKTNVIMLEKSQSLEPSPPVAEIERQDPLVFQQSSDKLETASYNTNLDATNSAAEAEGVTFEIIDDVGSDDEAINYDSDDWDMDEDEIDAMLESGMVNYGLQASSEAEQQEDDENPVKEPTEKVKIVLKERGHDLFDILPEGWVMITHNSGIPIYLHRTTRCVTLSRPYFLGRGSARKHDIPISAIPCLKYRRELEREKELEKEKSEDSTSSAEETTAGTQEELPESSLTNGQSNHAEPETPLLLTESESKSTEQSHLEKLCNGEVGSQSRAEKADASETEDSRALLASGEGPSVRIESIEKYKEEKTLDPIEVREYCQRLFTFHAVRVKQWRTWRDRRNHCKMLRGANARPSLPNNTKLITCPIIDPNQGGNNKSKKEFVLNPSRKSEICILHEFIQHALRVQPKYVFRELENATTPYSATVFINDVEYGTGYASSKKAAKNEAAKVSLGILNPEFRQITENKSHDAQDLSFFDDVKVEDPRVHDLCNKAGQLAPFQILCECLRRNFGMGDTAIKMEMNVIKHSKSEFTLSVGKHSTTVTCKNKREGKQMAAQAILQKLHPLITNWGSMLRLYGTDWKVIRKKKKVPTATLR